MLFKKAFGSGKPWLVRWKIYKIDEFSFQLKLQNSRPAYNFFANYSVYNVIISWRCLHFAYSSFAQWNCRLINHGLNFHFVDVSLCRIEKRNHTNHEIDQIILQLYMQNFQHLRINTERTYSLAKNLLD